jgi:hypothetical protein
VSINYNLTGNQRKAFIQATGEILGFDPVYQGAPSFSYKIGNYTVDRSGNLLCPDEVNSDEVDQLVAALKERGYEATETSEKTVESISEETTEGIDVVKTESDGTEASEDIADGTDKAPLTKNDSEDPYKLEVTVPREGFTVEALDNLVKIITSKETLIRKALNSDELPLKVDEDMLRFPWFTLSGTDGEADAYTRFVCAICDMAKNQKRVTAKEQAVENDKFAMRIFLVRLGLKGPEYKTARQPVRRIPVLSFRGCSRIVRPEELI